MNLVKKLSSPIQVVGYPEFYGNFFVETVEGELVRFIYTALKLKEHDYEYYEVLELPESEEEILFDICLDYSVDFESAESLYNKTMLLVNKKVSRYLVKLDELLDIYGDRHDITI